MKFPHQSKLGSILLSTACLVAFGLLAGPVIKPAGGVEVREASQTDRFTGNVRVPAGKSVIMESSVRILRASVADPELVRAIAIDDHELLINGKTPGRTDVTVWQEDGKQRKFDLHVDRETAPSIPLARARQEDSSRGLAASYQNAMARVETAITGVDR